MSGIERIIEIANVSDLQKSQLETYYALLLKWQKAINLVSPKSLPESWERHFLDSAQITQYVPETAKIYADLGCGAGFPGLVIAILRPELQVYLIESDERKGQFMRSVIRETGITNAQVITQRIEDYVSNGDSIPDFVSARALASLDKLCGFVLPWAEKNPQMTALFMKGENAIAEIEDAKKSYGFEVELKPSITDEKAALVLMRNFFLAK
ncbi:MAG: 16S rRNA (guanine(527)-N(7))-methyltransferase RsmG [Alphaproteobacteria bacterium]|nr:16S rRNA (guanine(527)-N(7))-methyltransferase RsmG [Alphaproteobacteria bacterium]